MAFLEVVQGTTPGQRFPLDGERMILGRHPDCDIVIEVGAVSRQHAQITRDGEEFVVEDLHSRNGTLVNGRLIQEATRLIDGDKLKICEWTLAYYLRESSQGPKSEFSPGNSTAMPLLVDDGAAGEPATIMSKLDMAGSRDFAHLRANPETKLRAMLEITHGLNRATSVDSLWPRLLDSLFKIFLQADRAFIVLQTADGKLIPKQVKHRRTSQEEQSRLSKTIVQQALSTKQAILSADAASDARFEMAQSIADFRIRSMMCVPLIDSEDRVWGVIQVDTLDQRQRFTQDDLDVLVGVANQAAFALENTHLHEMALKQQSLQRDLELAHKVQQGLLPSKPPRVNGYHFFDYYLAANAVGGDYYDYIQMGGGRVGIVLADVSGKGISAALLMARLSSEVRYALVSEPNPAAAVRRINNNFCQSGWEDRFVTFVLAQLDSARHEVTVVNAGHMAPLLRRPEGSVEMIGDDITGTPLGVIDDFPYEQATFPLPAGSFMTLFTDGISEAMNPARELYGIERLLKQLSVQQANVDALGKQILDDVRKFVGTHPQSDDMCLACFGRAD